MNRPMVGVKLPVSGVGIEVAEDVAVAIGLLVGVDDGLGVSEAEGVDSKAGPSDA